ncbi:MAG: hypothetical protein V3R16_02525 [Nitrospirales bacterium]
MSDWSYKRGKLLSRVRLRRLELKHVIAGLSNSVIYIAFSEGATELLLSCSLKDAEDLRERLDWTIRRLDNPGRTMS